MNTFAHGPLGGMEVAVGTGVGVEAGVWVKAGVNVDASVGIEVEAGLGCTAPPPQPASRMMMITEDIKSGFQDRIQGSYLGWNIKGTLSYSNIILPSKKGHPSRGASLSTSVEAASSTTPTCSSSNWRARSSWAGSIRRPKVRKPVCATMRSVGRRRVGSAL